MNKKYKIAFDSIEDMQSISDINKIDNIINFNNETSNYSDINSMVISSMINASSNNNSCISSFSNNSNKSNKNQFKNINSYTKSDASKSPVNINEIPTIEKNYRTRSVWNKYLQETEITDDLYLCYLPIINTKNYRDPMNSACDLCKDKLTYENDSIIICELCNTATHQSCYGGELVDGLPNEKWYCMRCDYLIKNNLRYDSVSCFLCPKDELQGIIKKYNNDKWAHIECINWTPEIYFEDKKKEKVYLDLLNKQRFTQLICKFCRKEEGSCIQCDYKDCLEAFHIRCAKNNKLIKKWDVMQKYEIDEYLPIFCEKHFKKINKTNKNKFHRFLGKKRSACGNLELKKDFKITEKEINQNNETINLIENISSSNNSNTEVKLESKNILPVSNKVIPNNYNIPINQKIYDEDCLICLSDGEEDDIQINKFIKENNNKKNNKNNIDKFLPNLNNEIKINNENIKSNLKNLLKNTNNYNKKLEQNKKDLSIPYKSKTRKIIDDSQEFDKQIKVTPQIVNNTIVNINTTNNFSNKTDKDITETIHHKSFQPLLEDLKLKVTTFTQSTNLNNTTNNMKNFNSSSKINKNLTIAPSDVSSSDEKILKLPFNQYQIETNQKEDENNTFSLNKEFSKKLNINHPITQEEFINLVLNDLEYDITPDNSKIYFLYKDQFYSQLGFGLVEKENELKNILIKNLDKYMKPIETKIKLKSNNQEGSATPKKSSGNIKKNLTPPLSINNSNSLGPLADLMKSKEEDISAITLKLYSLDAIKNRNFFKKSDSLKFKKF